MVIGSKDAELGNHFLTTYYRKWDLTVGAFKNIRLSKLSIFVNYDLDLHFRGHL